MFDWTEKADAALIAMREGAKASSTQIGKLLGCSRMAVIGRASRLGLGRLKPGTRDGDKKSSPENSAPVMPVPPLNIPLVDLEPHHCREVVSPDGVTAAFCGHPKDGDTSYCIHHRRINLVVATGKIRPFIRPRVRAA